MNVKIDTKEKFTVITPIIADITANMTGELVGLLLGYLKKEVPHIILNMKNVLSINDETGEKIAATQQQFYENNHSFIICELNKDVESLLDKKGLLEFMNVTPTESEAWDIVQMEEIERELLGDMDEPGKE
jgi:anti-anti-sigma regulatory factor